MPLISVVVPVYNVEKYLSKCVESILAQGIEDLELLLVNDGSKDSSLDICNQYAQKDDRIRVISKENGGVSSARNLGLDNATGEWVTFVDADDWLDKKAFATCRPYMDDCEIIRFSTLDVFAEGKSHPRRVRPAKDWNEAFRQVVGHRTVIGICGTLYRRCLFEENNIRFDTEIVYGEDWWVVTQAMYRSRKVKVLPELFGYIYNRSNETSCSNTISSAKLIQSLIITKRIGEMVGEGYEKELKRTRCYRAGFMVKMCGLREAGRAIKANQESIPHISLFDILTAKLHLSMRCRLLRLWLGYLAWQ